MDAAIKELKKNVVIKAVKGLYRGQTRIDDDAGYRGEVKVVMINLGPAPYEIRAGMKIAQMLIQPVSAVFVEESADLDDTSRGAGGFGSTGLY